MILSRGGWEELLNYRYSAIDKSFVTHYVLRHYWNYCVTLFPTWMAPNLITTLGFAFVFGSFILANCYIPDFQSPAPRLHQWAHRRLDYSMHCIDDVWYEAWSNPQGFYGPSFWLQSATEIVPFSGEYIPETWSLVDFVLAVMAFLLFTTHIPVCLARVYSVCKGKNAFSMALLQLSPFVCLSAASFAWLSSPFSEALEKHIVAFSIAIGIVFAEIATRIILAHLLKQEFPMYTSLLLPAVIGALIACAPVFFEIEFWGF
ncbi:MAG: hypothetical protein SGCHY_000177 [Lobulomycetales sp.]